MENMNHESVFVLTIIDENGKSTLGVFKQRPNEKDRTKLTENAVKKGWISIDNEYTYLILEEEVRKNEKGNKHDSSSEN
jgi:hypothetical protein